MGWQDRDWAKWTDEERTRFVGGGGGGVGMLPGALAGVVVSLVAAVVLTHPFRPARPALPPPVYGSGVVESLMGGRTTCTKEQRDSERWTCEVWSILGPGQQALPAAPLPPGSLCTTVVADQEARRWTCATPS